MNLPIRRATFTRGPAARIARLAGISLSAAALTLLAACSGSGRPKPTPLEDFKPSRTVQTVWSTKVGSAQGPLSLAAQAGQVTMAAADGTLVSLDAATGKERWRAAVGASVAAGVGSDGRFSAIVTADNELVVLDGAQVKWRERLPGRALTAPLVAGERVFVQLLDRSVRAYDVVDARWIWQFQRPGGEPLALSQQGVLTAFRDTLVVGVGSRLVGLDPARGSVRFEASLGVPRGSNEVERLADLIGPAVRAEDDLCVRAFQLSAGCIDMNRGTVRWTRPQAGTQGVAASNDLVVGADGADRLSAWNADTGEVLWRVERFQYRGLGAPAYANGLIAVGDQEGYLHFLAAQDGRTVARVSLDGPVNGAPRLVNGLLLVATRAGTLYALRTP
jgi:outer membrane assembly lipoprotein YfgL